MVKKLSYFILILLLLFTIIGIFGVRWFHNMWFKETPVHLKYDISSKPIDFNWNTNTYGAYFEQHSSMLIPVKIKDLPNKFYFQFDTGSPSTMIYGNTLKSLKSSGLNVRKIIKENKSYLEEIHLDFNRNETDMFSVRILEDYGESFNVSDTINEIIIGTIGADFLHNRIAVINFKSQFLQLYTKRPNWMNALTTFKPFSFKGRRFMLPAKIDGSALELFYDSGSSGFGLITTKNRYDKLTDKSTEEYIFDANRFGDPIPIHYKYTEKRIEIGGVNLDLKSVSYVNMYASFQKLMTPFTKIGGWLGNKSFTESVLILDTQKKEFTILEN